MSETESQSNFDYIKDIEGCKELYDACREAEERQSDDPRESARQCRKAIEIVCRMVGMKENIESAKTDSLSAMLDNEKLLVALGNIEIERPIRQVRRRSNATANLGEDMEGMPYVVEMLYHIVGTMLHSQEKIEAIPTYVPHGVSFIIPEDLGE